MTPTPDPDPTDMTPPPGLFESTIREFLDAKDPIPETIDLTIIPKCDIPAHAFCLVTPPPAVQAYLNSDDEMTEHIVNLMEETMDRHYDPLVVAASRTLHVDCHEPPQLHEAGTISSQVTGVVFDQPLFEMLVVLGVLQTLGPRDAACLVEVVLERCHVAPLDRTLGLDELAHLVFPHWPRRQQRIPAARSHVARRVRIGRDPAAGVGQILAVSRVVAPCVVAGLAPALVADGEPNVQRTTINAP